jgi:hypothetical protein
VKAEKDIINEILLRASERGHRLFRQNTGKGWVGRIQRGGPANTVTLREPRPLIAGLCVGSSDVIGYTATGRFVALEVKTPGVRITPEQKAFLDAARARGCITGVVFSVDEALALLPE